MKKSLGGGHIGSKSSGSGVIAACGSRTMMKSAWISRTVRIFGGVHFSSPTIGIRLEMCRSMDGFWRDNSLIFGLSGVTWEKAHTRLP